MKWIDTPPVWLCAALVLAWYLGGLSSLGLSTAGAWTGFAGGLLVGAGIVIFLLAAWELYRHRTTILPKSEASALVTTGIFSRSRNPIYLADALLLAGLVLKWEAVLALPLVPCFIWLIEQRFILPEEEHLRRRFRADFAAYRVKTRRWI